MPGRLFPRFILRLFRAENAGGSFISIEQQLVKNVFLAAFDVMGLFLVPIATDNYAVASVRPGVGTALSGVSEASGH